jgi:hypothetical protein
MLTDERKKSTYSTITSYLGGKHRLKKAIINIRGHGFSNDERNSGSKVRETI